MLAGFDGSHEALAHIFQTMKLPASALEEFLANVGSGDVISRSTESDLMAEGIGANLSHTWFAIQGGSAVQAPATGSRPGDPNADLLFSFIMSKILASIRQRARQADIPLEASGDFGDMIHYAAWVDDVAFAVFSEATLLLDKTTALLAIITDVMTEHGLKLSFGPGKTAVLMDFYGTHARTQRQRCDKLKHGKLPLMTEHFGCIEVPLTNHYKYLGGFLTRGGGALQEIRVRAACALHNIQPLKKLTTRTDLDVKHRRTLIRSFGLSRLTLHSGTWSNLSQGEFRCWHAAVYKLYQSVQGRLSDGTVSHASMYLLADLMQSPMPLELLYICRLRVLFHLIKIADPFLIASILHNHQLAHNASWLYGAIKSVQWLQDQLGAEDVPDELAALQDLQTWHDFQPAHRELHRLLKKVERAHLLRVKNFCVLQQHQQKQNDLLRDMNWTVPDDNPISSTAHECDSCGRHFVTQAALATHQQRKHGMRVAMRGFAADDVCRACQRKYHTRPRLIQHLHHGQTQCWLWHLRKYFPLSIEQMQALDDRDRELGVAFHQHGFVDFKVDKAWAHCNDEDLTDILNCRHEGTPELHEPTVQELAHLECPMLSFWQL